MATLENTKAGTFTVAILSHTVKRDCMEKGNMLGENTGEDGVHRMQLAMQAEGVGDLFGI
jgi:hypothetical protein